MRPIVKTCDGSGPTEIEASVFTDKLQRIHQLSPTQRLCRGYFHNVERQGQCKQQRATGRRHLLDLQAKETHAHTLQNKAPDSTNATTRFIIDDIEEEKKS